MKLTKLNRYTLIALASISLAGLWSCSSNEDFDIADETVTSGSSLTFTFSLEKGVPAGRGANGYDGANTGVIGTGSMVDYLVFAIYDGDDNLLTRFAKDEHSSLTIGDKTLTAGNGQNILKWNGSSVSVQVASLTEGDYKIVCWAQSSECDAYDTSDLSSVVVSYDHALNNDESRDAYCVSQPFTVSASVSQGVREVILTRPFAQINVGTTGADYKNTATTPGGAFYTYSAIQVKGVATTIDVVTNTIGSATTDADFGFSKIPAYNGMEVPTASDELLETGGEEFLKIHLNDVSDTSNTSFAGYLTDYPTVAMGSDGKVSEYLTETFKYLSMCYVLVPGKTAFNNVKVTFASQADGNGMSTYFAIPNVPADINWRTNIIGGMYAPSTPSDPSDPDTPSEPVDDPSSLFNGISANLLIVTGYNNGDNNFQREEAADDGYSEIN